MNKLGICVVICFAALTACRTSKEGYVAKGNKLFAAGKYPDAELQYRNAIQRDSHFGEAYYRLGLAAIKLNNAREAYESLLRAVQLLPNNVDVREKYADVCLAIYLADPKRPEMLYRQIKQLSNDILAANANSYEGLMLKGYVDATDRKPKEAIADFRKALAINNSDPGVMAQLVRLLFQEGQTQEALKLAADVVTRHKTYGPIYDLMYGFYAGGGHMTEAENVLKAKVANNPKQADYLLELARHYYRLQKPQEMTATLQRLLGVPTDFPQGRLWVGDFYLGLKDYPEALRNYQEGVSANKEATQRVVYQKRVIITLRAQGERQKAFELANQVAKENPGDADASHLQADLALEVRKAENADDTINTFQTLLARTPNDAGLLLQLGRAYRLKGDLAKAREQFQASLAKRNNLIEPRLELADIDMTQHQFTEALQQVNEILRVQPKNPQARLLHARILTATGKWKDSRTELTNLLKDSPNDNNAKLELGVLAIQERRNSDAINIFDELRDTDPRASAGLATAYASQHQIGKAEDVIQTALKKWPDALVLLEQMGEIEAANGNYDAAIAQFRELLAKNPKSVETLRHLGDIYEAKGDRANAIALYQQASQLVPTDVNVALRLADMLAFAGRNAEAKQAYEGLLKIHPDNPGGLNNLAFFLADSGGDLDEALGLAQRALARFPNQPALSDTLGYIYLKKGLTESAVQTFQKLVQKNPQLASFHYHLGLAMFQKGDRTSARKELESALKLSTLPPQDKVRVTALLAKIG